jgi:hypothetical protein
MKQLTLFIMGLAAIGIHAQDCNFITTTVVTTTTTTTPAPPPPPPSSPTSGLSAAGYYLSDGTNYYEPISMFQATLPVASSFSWVNQGPATVSTLDNALVMHSPMGNGSTAFRMLAQPIGTNTTLTVSMIANQIYNPYASIGVGFYESATNKLEVLAIGPAGSGFTQIGVNQYNGTGGGSYYASPFNGGSVFPHIWFFRLKITGGTITHYWSMDGKVWNQVYSEPQTAFFASAPDKWGWFIDQENSTHESHAVLLSWKVE